MFKTLLVTTCLVAAAAPVLADEVVLKPSAKFGIRSTDAGSNWDPDATLALGISFLGASDDGLEFGGTFTVETGNLADSHGSNTEGTIIDPYIFVRGSFGEVYAKENDDDEAVFGLTNTIGATSYVLEYNWELEHFKAGLTQNFGAFSLGGEVNTDSEWNVKAGYDNGRVNGSVKVDQDDVFTFTAGFVQSDFSLGVEYDTNEDWKIVTGYAKGLHSITAELYRDDDYSVEANYGINDRLSLYADVKVEDQGEQEIGAGIKMSF